MPADEGRPASKGAQTSGHIQRQERDQCTDFALDSLLQDRIPWLRKIRSVARVVTAPAPGEELAGTNDVGRRKVLVVACSALKRVYRDILRGLGEEDHDLLEVGFIYCESRFFLFF